jgi:hypothetical protein
MKFQECTCICGCKRLDYDNICSECKVGACIVIHDQPLPFTMLLNIHV